jgi:hypothetical protein
MLIFFEVFDGLKIMLAHSLGDRGWLIELVYLMKLDRRASSRCGKTHQMLEAKSNIPSFSRHVFQESSYSIDVENICLEAMEPSCLPPFDYHFLFGHSIHSNFHP